MSAPATSVPMVVAQLWGKKCTKPRTSTAWPYGEDSARIVLPTGCDLVRFSRRVSPKTTDPSNQPSMAKATRAIAIDAAKWSIVAKTLDEHFLHGVVYELEHGRTTPAIRQIRADRALIAPGKLLTLEPQALRGGIDHCPTSNFSGWQG